MSVTDYILRLNIVTPHISIEQKADFVNLPAMEGEIGILPKHIPLISSLKTGIIKVDFNDKKINYFIEKGIVCINDNVIQVITDFAVDLANITEDKVREKIDQLKASITGHDNEAQHKELIIQKALLLALKQI